MTDETANLIHSGTRLPPSLPLRAAVAAILIAALAWVAILLTDTGTISLAWSNRDFANYWIAARMALAGDVTDLFAPQPVYFSHMSAVFGPDYPWHNWSYPPHYLLTVLPVGLLGYKPALVAYLLGTFLILCGSIRLLAPQADHRQFLLLMPAIVANALAAQNGFFTAALLLCGLAARYERPVLAGVCFGLLTIKPQLGVLLPLLLVFERRWMVFATAAATTLLLVAISVAVFGLSSWRGYLDHVVPYQTSVMREGTGIFLHMMPSMFGSMRSLGFPADPALAAHLPLAVAALGLWIFSLRRLQASGSRAASTVFATFVVVPYTLSYDLVALAAVAALWPFAGGRPARGALAFFLAAVAVVPIVMPYFGLASLPITSLVIPLAWITLLANEGALPTRRRSATSA